VEILPARTYPLLVERHPELRDRPVLGGGLIKDRRDQHAILKAGAIGISTSDERLWKGA
jgi:glycerol uptake operon antiterminator